MTTIGNITTEIPDLSKMFRSFDPKQLTNEVFQEGFEQISDQLNEVKNSLPNSTVVDKESQSTKQPVVSTDAGGNPITTYVSTGLKNQLQFEKNVATTDNGISTDTSKNDSRAIIIGDLVSAGVGFTNELLKNNENNDYNKNYDSSVTKDTSIQKLNLTVDFVYDALMKTESRLKAKGERLVAEHIYEMIRYLKENDPNKYNQFVTDFGIDINFNNKDNSVVQKLLVKGVIRYFGKIYNNNLINAAIATYFGNTITDEIFTTYGYPTTLNHYTLLSQDLKDDGNIKASNFIITLLEELKGV